MSIRLRYSILAILIVLLPKFNIINIPGNSQGIRFEDFLISVLFIINFFKYKYNKRILIWLGYIFCISLLGLFINPNEYLVLRMLSLVRVVQYIIVCVAFVSLKIENRIAIAKIVIISQFLISVIQFFVYGDFRAQGTTAGPWELAMLVILCYVYLKVAELNVSLVYSILVTLIILLAGARMQFIAWILIFFNMHRGDLYFSKKIIFGILFVTALVTSYFLLINDNYIKFDGLIHFAKSDLLYEYIDFLISPNGEDLYDIRKIQDSSQDLSLISRLNQWGVYIHTLFQSKAFIYSLIFGSGLNSGGITCDGQYIKNFVDLGLLGLMLYFSILYKSLKSSNYINVSILFIIGSFSLDVIWASKFMYMFCIFFYPVFAKHELRL